MPHFLKDILLRLIYTLEHLGISSSYQKADEIHFSVKMEKTLACAIIGNIVTYMKSEEKKFLLFFFFL